MKMNKNNVFAFSLCVLFPLALALAQEAPVGPPAPPAPQPSEAATPQPQPTPEVTEGTPENPEVDPNEGDPDEGGQDQQPEEAATPAPTETAAVPVVTSTPTTVAEAQPTPTPISTLAPVPGPTTVTSFPTPASTSTGVAVYGPPAPAVTPPARALVQPTSSARPTIVAASVAAAPQPSPSASAGPPRRYPHIAASELFTAPQDMMWLAGLGLNNYNNYFSVYGGFTGRFRDGNTELGVYRGMIRIGVINLRFRGNVEGPPIELWRKDWSDGTIEFIFSPARGTINFDLPTGSEFARAQFLYTPQVAAALQLVLGRNFDVVLRARVAGYLGWVVDGDDNGATAGLQFGPDLAISYRIPPSHPLDGPNPPTGPTTEHRLDFGATATASRELWSARDEYRNRVLWNGINTGEAYMGYTNTRTFLNGQTRVRRERYIRITAEHYRYDVRPLTGWRERDDGAAWEVMVVFGANGFDHLWDGWFER